MGKASIAFLCCLDHTCPTGHSVMKVYNTCAVQCRIQWTYVPIEHFMCGLWYQGTELLIFFDHYLRLSIKSTLWLVVKIAVWRPAVFMWRWGGCSLEPVGYRLSVGFCGYTSEDKVQQSQQQNPHLERVAHCVSPVGHSLLLWQIVLLGSILY